MQAFLFAHPNPTTLIPGWAFEAASEMTFGGPTRTRRVFSAIAAVWIQRVLEIGNHRASQTGTRPFHLHAPCCKLHTEKSAGPGSSPTRYPVPKATPNTGCNLRRTRPPCSKCFKDFGLGSCLRSCGVLAVSSQLAFRGALWEAAVASCSQAKDYLEGALVQDRESERFVFPLKPELKNRFCRGERRQGPAPRDKPAPCAAAPRLHRRLLQLDAAMWPLQSVFVVASLGL